MNRAGFEIETAEDGVDTLEKVPKFKPDLIMLDLNMPRKNGIEVFIEPKEDPKTAGIAVLILTNAFPEDELSWR